MRGNVIDASALGIKEHVHGARHALISWKAIFAGLLVALITYVALMALGAGIGGASATDAIENNRNAQALVGGVGIWMSVAALLSLMAGSYFAARMSTL